MAAPEPQSDRAVKPAEPTSADASASRAVMVGHAIAFLNNHVGCFGFGQEFDTDWKTRTDAIEALPTEIRQPFIAALADAARFLSRAFAPEPTS